MERTVRGGLEAAERGRRRGGMWEAGEERVGRDGNGGVERNGGGRGEERRVRAAQCCHCSADLLSAPPSSSLGLFFPLHPSFIIAASRNLDNRGQTL